MGAVGTQHVKAGGAWFPGKDSNLRSRIQSPLPYLLATRDRVTTLARRWRVSGVTSSRFKALGLQMRLVILGALILLTAACGAYSFPASQSPSPDTGTVTGRVVAVPCAPVEKAGEQCAGRPVASL